LVIRRDQGGTRWEDFFLLFGAANRAAKKQREGHSISFKRPPLAETTQQPTEIRISDGAGSRYKIRPRRNVWEGNFKFSSQ